MRDAPIAAPSGQRAARPRGSSAFACAKLSRGERARQGRSLIAFTPHDRTNPHPLSRHRQRRRRAAHGVARVGARRRRAGDEAIALRRRDSLRAGRDRRGARRRGSPALPAGHARRRRGVVRRRRSGGRRAGSRARVATAGAHFDLDPRGRHRWDAKPRTRTASSTRTATRPAPRSRGRSSRASAARSRSACSRRRACSS